ncbi:salicylate hydroxylase [Actinoplanes sp. OR16]|uniref:FAD-dependent monooxygenase n=1 Tax=Actinoplanes sp. OR16 TaxID=946334 RepID=UPI000F6F7393|nr:FAD-dependent monooxygenase [Actinoplanes sp. OR16]BBH70261.1 salicylate hydroxylase [Actinoplanes sp. OR16]
MDIIGGGIGGLAAAAALAQIGRRVTVHERDEALPDTGTALGIWPAALRALDQIGAGDEVRAAGIRPRRGAFLRPDGSTIATIDVDRLHARTGDHIFMLSRPALLKILYRTAVRAGAEVRFGSTAQGTIVADGVFSRTRERLLGPAYRARYSGTTAWRGVITGMPTETFAEIWGPGVKFGVTPHEGGHTNWFASAAMPEGLFHPGHELQALRRIFGSWAAPVRPVLDAIEESGILRHDIYVTPPLPSYVHEGIVLIGDAAHAMAPDLGRGACEALIDAVTLAACLRHDQGLSLYDRKRRPATQRLARMAGMAARLTRMRHALPVRDGLLKVGMLAGPPG